MYIKICKSTYDVHDICVHVYMQHICEFYIIWYHAMKFINLGRFNLFSKQYLLHKVSEGKDRQHWIKSTYHTTVHVHILPIVHTCTCISQKYRVSEVFWHWLFDSDQAFPLLMCIHQWHYVTSDRMYRVSKPVISC